MNDFKMSEIARGFISNTSFQSNQAISEHAQKPRVFDILIDEMKVRGFSRRTIAGYCYINSKFLQFIKKSPRDVTKNDIESYLVHLYDGNKSSATRHLACAALKFYYEDVLKRRFGLKYPKKSSKLPIVLSKDEILKMIGSIENSKHKLLLELMYGSGLRVGEAVKIKIEDFDVNGKTLHVKNGKGSKDRIVNLSEKFICDFMRFVNGKAYGYLFLSAHRIGNHISTRTAEKIVKNALRKASITKKAHPHTLRTSFATHLIENGIDISYVQKLLGHSRISTTQGYIRLSQSSVRSIKSPLD